MNVNQSIKEKVLQGRELSKAEENVLCQMVKKSYKPATKEECSLSREEACELLFKYVANMRRLAPENHLALFEVDNPEEILRKYFRTWSLSGAAEMKLFELDPTGELASKYSEYNSFDENPEIKFMTWPNCEEAQRRYVAQGALNTRTRNKLLELTSGEQFIRQEMELRRIFSVSTQVLMLKSPNAHEWMKRYTHYANLCEGAQAELFKMPKPKKMVRLYDSRRGLYEEARELAESYGWL